MTCTPEDIKLLFAEFPPESIHWRAQTVTKDGTKALALAYLDARDVMDRLDSVCGSENWQDRYEFSGARTICYLSIRINDEWISKADGAGDTDVEAEKGAISDALKRAAVKWGIGRYLYDMGNVWVPCQSSEYNGKKKWQKFTDDPWNYVKGASKPKSASKNDDARKTYDTLVKDMRALSTKESLRAWWNNHETINAKNTLPNDWQETLRVEWVDLGTNAPTEADKFKADVNEQFPPESEAA